MLFQQLRKSIVISLLIAAGLATVAVAFCLYEFERRLPADEDIGRVKLGMTRRDVESQLGAFYDLAKRGEYEDTDRIIETMEDEESVSYVCVWAIRFSDRRIFVGFDEHDVVVSTVRTSR